MPFRPDPQHPDTILDMILGPTVVLLAAGALAMIAAGFVVYGTAFFWLWLTMVAGAIAATTIAFYHAYPVDSHTYPC